MRCCKLKANMEINTSKKPCVVYLPAELKKFLEPDGNQLLTEVPIVIKPPQSWNPKDPKANKTNKEKTNGEGPNPLKSKYWTKEETKLNEYPMKEKIPDELRLSPGRPGKIPPMTAHRIAEISLQEHYQIKGKHLILCPSIGSST